MALNPTQRSIMAIQTKPTHAITGGLLLIRFQFESMTVIWCDLRTGVLNCRSAMCGGTNVVNGRLIARRGEGLKFGLKLASPHKLLCRQYRNTWNNVDQWDPAFILPDNIYCSQSISLRSRFKPSSTYTLLFDTSQLAAPNLKTSLYAF